MPATVTMLISHCFTAVPISYVYLSAGFVQPSVQMVSKIEPYCHLKVPFSDKSLHEGFLDYFTELKYGQNYI